MMRTKVLWLTTAVFVFLAAWFIYGQPGVQAQRDLPQPLSQGGSVAGNIADRYGEEWSLYSCAGDLITVTVQSTVFAPNLELYPPVGRTPLVASNNVNQRTIQVNNVQLPATGEYTVAVLGSSVRDRGAYSLTLVISGTTPLPEDVQPLSPGITVSGTVNSRYGEEWGFRGCAQDVITLTTQSIAAVQGGGFAPMLELYGPTGRTPLATSAASTNRRADIIAFTLPQTGDYTVLAAGQNIRDRGPYTLTLVMATGNVTATQAVSTATVATPVPPTAPLCTVVSTGGLRLRSGPGQIYPIIGTLQANAQLRPRARDASSTWIEIEFGETKQRGWVSAATQYVNCSVAVNTLPLGLIPPAPTFTPTPPPPTATPKPVAADPGLPQPEGVLVQGPGGDPGNLAGDIYTAPGTLAGYQNDDPIFRDHLYFELYVFDPAYGAGSGAGIDNVTFNIYCPNGGSYSRTESTARYCSFGGGEPFCTAIPLKQGAFLPDSDCLIEESNDYSVSIDAFPSDQRRQEGNWNFDFAIDLPGGGDGNSSTERQPLVANVAQITPGGTDSFVTTALVFQVEAYDRTIGNADGDGIENVDFWIYGSDGGEVYHRTEGNVRYCAFGGGEPDCTIFDLQSNDHWPDNGPEIQNGPHMLRAVAHGQDGRSQEVRTAIEIQVNR